MSLGESYKVVKSIKKKNLNAGRLLFDDEGHNNDNFNDN